MDIKQDNGTWTFFHNYVVAYCVSRTGRKIPVRNYKLGEEISSDLVKAAGWLDYRDRWKKLDAEGYDTSDEQREMYED